MVLDIEQIRKELRENRKGAILSRAQAHQNRIKFHVETKVSSSFSQPLADFMSYVSALIPDDKFRIFKTLFRFPIKTNEITEIAFDKLFRVFDGRDPKFNYQFRSSQQRADWEWYRQTILHEPEIWRSVGWEYFKTEINSVLVVDMPQKQEGTLPEPYFYWLKIKDVLTFEADPVTGQMSWIIFRQPEDRIAVIDGESYRIFEFKKNQIGELLLEKPHDIGYCPARFFWDQPLSLEDHDVKKSPITKQLESLDWFLYFHIAKRHLDTYAGYPVYSGYAMDCDFRNDEAGDYCDGGFLRDKHDHWKYDANGLVRCPVCSSKRLSGAGSFVEVPIPGEGQPDLHDPVKITTVDRHALEYNVSEEERLKNNIIDGIVGVDSPVLTSQAVNEKQVSASYDSKTTVLKGIKEGLERAMKWVDETICRCRYGTDFLSASISLGTDFYLLSPSDLRSLYTNAKNSGASEAELDSLQRQIIETEYRDNPLELQRMLTLNELEPYRHIGRTEALGLFEKQLIPEDDLRIKLNFPDYVRRFERENTNVIEFGSALPFNKKINRIKEEFKKYAAEEKARVSITPPAQE